MTILTLDWESPNAADWDGFLSECPMANAFQDWHWGDATRAAGEATPRRAYVRFNDVHVGLLQLFETRSMGILKLARVIRGPVFFRPVPPEAHLHALGAARRAYPLSRLSRLVAMPELPDGPATRQLFADAGFTRIEEGYHTERLSLAGSEEKLRKGLRQNFRNQLRKAEAEIRDVRANAPGMADWLIRRFEAQKREKRFGGPSAALLEALPEGSRMTLTAHDGDGDAIAGTLFHLHGRNATYQIGWSNADGRAAHALNLLLWRGVVALRKRGFRALDLGGTDEDTAPGVAHFKQGLGGEAFTLAGGFV